MAATTYTFKRYTWGEYDANADDGLNMLVEWDSLPNQYGEWDDVMAAADWHDTEETGVGVLTRPWNGHPEGALIVSDDARPGLDFAVSNEPVR